MINDSNIKFAEARDHLSCVLSRLEEVIFNKLEEVRIKDINNKSGLDKEGKQTIENLNSEINLLQKNLSELGTENELLTKKNNNLLKIANKITDDSREIISAIKFDLKKIKLITNHSNNNADS